VQLGLPFVDDSIAPTPVSAFAPTRESSIAPTRVSPIAPASNPSIYFVRHRRARRYLLRVDHDGRVRVTIPRGGSKREADAFVQRHVEWVARQRARLTPSAFGTDERLALRERARTELPARLLEIAAHHGLGVTGVSIRNQRTRWGSCGRDGKISLNWRLVLMPAAVRDYVLIHELMHLKRLDHSPAYWKLVASACPGYRDARQWLRTHGPALR
jgi:predicted metal-dependent hydrolase